MHFTTTSIVAGLVALRPVAADFSIFAATENQFPDSIQSVATIFFNNPPDCDDIVNGAVEFTNNFYNDASGGGVACDGCDASKATPDWDITRFEINDDSGEYFAGPQEKMHMTLYKDEATGRYGLYDVDMNSLGSCERPADPQTYTCPDVLSADSGTQTFRCTAAITIKNSN